MIKVYLTFHCKKSTKTKKKKKSFKEKIKNLINIPVTRDASIFKLIGTDNQFTASGIYEKKINDSEELCCVYIGMTKRKIA